MGIYGSEVLNNQKREKLSESILEFKIPKEEQVGPVVLPWNRYVTLQSRGVTVTLINVYSSLVIGRQ